MSASASMSTPTSTARSGKPRSSSADSLLLLTSARLALESARADAAERQVLELLSRVRSLHQEKLELQGQLSKSQQELQLWKIQLDQAQNEIHRAQEIVDQIERARTDAEQRADRDRQRARQLIEERAIEFAMDEGRRLGFQQGLDHGRRRAPPPPPPPAPSRPRRRRASAPEGSAPESSSSSRRRRPPPDTAPYAGILPVPTVVTPAPVAVPETQPQPPVSISNSRPESIRSREIDLDDPTPIHPVTLPNDPPTTHDTFQVPPDNYIPTIRQGEPGITLPPPHEWVNQPGRPRSDSRGTRPRSDSVKSARPSKITVRSPPVPRVRDFAYRADPPPIPIDQPSSSSVTSRDSTRISQFELLSPPKEQDKAPVDEPRSEMTQPERIVEEWRSQNSDFLTPAPEAKRENPPASFIQRPMSSEPLRPVPPVPIDRPTTTEPSRSRTPKSSTGPRKTRQVILPVPISSVFYDASTSQQSNTSHASGEWLRSRFQKERSVSNATIPNIDVEPPSHSPTNSEGTVVDPVLLTPERIPLVIDNHSSDTPKPTSGIYAKPDHHHPHYTPMARDGAGELITGIIPSQNALPPGFVPLSPIPSLSNLDRDPHADAHSGTKAHPLPPPYKLSSAAGRAASPGPMYSSVPVPGPLSHGLPLQGLYPAPVPPVPDIVVMRTEVASSPRERHQRHAWSPAPLNRPFSIFSDT